MGAYLIDPISDAVHAEFSQLVSWGKWNRRPIAGTNIWSQHSWANAEDIADPNDLYASPLLDEVAAWLRYHRKVGTVFGDGAKVGTVLWRVRNHWDHIHYERAPKQSGTPPLRPPLIDYQNEETMKTEDVQRALVDAGFDLGDYGPNKDGVDGKWGPTSHAAFVKALKSGGVPADVVSRAEFAAHRHAEGTTGKPI